MTKIRQGSFSPNATESVPGAARFRYPYGLCASLPRRRHWDGRTGDSLRPHSCHREDHIPVSHLTTLVLRGDALHPLAELIHSPLLTSVKVMKLGEH